jgi:hypothetical protein
MVEAATNPARHAVEPGEPSPGAPGAEGARPAPPVKEKVDPGNPIDGLEIEGKKDDGKTDL